MIEKPIKTPKQLSDIVENKEDNIGTAASSSSNNTFVFNTNADMVGVVDSAADTAPEVDALPLSIEIAPADVASVDMSRFLQYLPTYSANDKPPLKLPDGFSFSITPLLSGKYGTIVTSPSGEQSVTVNLEIPDVNGIISYEVRLVKND